jgi:hypothetical protein
MKPGGMKGFSYTIGDGREGKPSTMIEKREP